VVDHITTTLHNKYYQVYDKSHQYNSWCSSRSEDWNEVKPFHDLETLRIMNFCSSYLKGPFEMFVSRHITLTTIQISDCQKISSDQFVVLFGSLPLLTDINLENTVHITKAVLNVIGNTSKSLRILNINCCDVVLQENGLDCVITSCEALEEVCMARKYLGINSSPTSLYHRNVMSVLNDCVKLRSFEYTVRSGGHGENRYKPWMTLTDSQIEIVGKISTHKTLQHVTFGCPFDVNKLSPVFEEVKIPYIVRMD
jgi:hypothetical protein